MARKFLTAIDLTQLELQNARVQNLASAPGSPVKGQIYMNSTDNTLYWYDGTAWVAAKAGTSIAFGAVPAETTFGIAKADGVAATAARSDHTHGSPAHNASEHSTIPLSALAAAGAAINMGGFVINNVGTPVAATDAANKGYVDNAIAGLSWKQAARYLGSAQRALSSLTPAVDTGAITAGDRILLIGQTNQAENGVYIAASGAWTRATDMDTGPECVGAAVYVGEGTTFGDTAWVMTTNGTITLGTTPLSWSQFAGGGSVTAGAGMTQSGNVLNVIAGDATLTVAADSIVRAPLTGDVTTAVNAATIAALAVTTGKIANDAVDNTKLANMAQFTVKGRNTAAAGDPEDVSAGQLAGWLVGFYTKKYTANINAATSTVITHSLGTQDVQVQVYRVAAPYDTIECDVERTDTNNVTVRFAVAPAASEYKVVIIG